MLTQPLYPWSVQLQTTTPPLGVAVHTLAHAHTATLSLVRSVADHYATAWCRSAHTQHIEPTIKDALRIATGCLRPAPLNNLPVLTGIQQAELHHKKSMLSLVCRALKPGDLLHSALTGRLDEKQRR